MEKTTQYILIGLGTVAVIGAGIYFIPKLIKKSDETDTGDKIDFDVEITKILNSWGAMSQTERNAMVKDKLNIAELSRTFVLMAEYKKSGKGTSQSDKEELYRLLNRIFTGTAKSADGEMMGWNAEGEGQKAGSQVNNYIWNGKPLGK